MHYTMRNRRPKLPVFMELNERHREFRQDIEIRRLNREVEELQGVVNNLTRVVKYLPDAYNVWLPTISNTSAIRPTEESMRKCRR